ncbi:unnamed protein product [Caenorhabditis nigoni]
MNLTSITTGFRKEFENSEIGDVPFMFAIFFLPISILIFIALQIIYPFYSYVNRINRERDKNSLVFLLVDHFYEMMKITNAIFVLIFVLALILMYINQREKAESTFWNLVYEWFARFKNGDESLDDHEHGSRPQTVDNDLLKQTIESDPRQTVRELAQQFGCSHGTIANHLHAIGKTNRCGKWTPHELTDANKSTRVATAGILLSRAKRSGFLDSIVTGDEKWIRYDNTTKKREWLSVGEHPKPTPKPDLHGKKVMLCVWWNSEGVVYFEILDSCQTVTADLYRHQLDHVDEALRRKGVDTTTTKLLHDNARPHVAKITSQKIDELGWEVLPHAPYSPDTAPSDFHLFRSMQHSLAEKHFKNHDEIKKWVDEYFASQPAQFFHSGIHSLRARWQRVIDADGEYILD